MSIEVSAIVLAWIAIILLGFAMSGLLRQVRFLTHQAGKRVERFPLVGEHVAPVDSRSWSAPTVLVFARGDCEVCERRLAEVDALAQSESEVRFVAIFADYPNGFTGSRIDVVRNDEAAFSRFKVPVVPFGVVVGSGGLVVDAGPLGSTEAVERLLARARSSK